MSVTSRELRATNCWDALEVLLRASVEADVQAITDKDFDNGELVLNPPTVRILYAGTGRSAVESQRTAYESVHRFLCICGDENRRSLRDQAIASLMLAEEVETQLAGARLRLSTNERTEPITLVSKEPMDVQRFGVAYAVAVEVPGPSVYSGPNANPPAFAGVTP